jgi:glycosyltransferase involved in cell wall biosynthesis
MRIIAADTTIDGDLIGGAQTFLPKLLKGLVNKGHEVHLIAKGEPNEKVSLQIADSGACLHTDIWDAHGLISDEAPALAGWLNKLAPDIFLISVSGDMGWAVLPMLNGNIATLSLTHSDSKGFYDPLKHYAKFITTGIGVSEEICKQFEDYCGLTDDRIKWIPYGVEVAERMPQQHNLSQKPKLVYVGRLEEAHKRVSDLIRIVKKLRNSELDYSLKIIGDGPSMPNLVEELADEIRFGKVKLTGWRKNEEIVEDLRRSDISLLVSESEGFCIALVEAMANGCCPIVTDIRSGNKQLVRDGKNGFVIPVGDVGAFVEKIVYLAKTPEKLLEFRKRAWETGKQYSIERMVGAYEAAFERAIEDARARPRRTDPNFPLMESCRSKYPLWLRRIKAAAMSYR